MLKTLFRAARDAGTLKTLCENAEALARAEGQKKPEAEHFVAAALNLPDGSARRVFARLGLDAAAFGAALAEQERQALKRVGIDDQLIDQALGEAISLPPPSAIYDAAPSGQIVVRELARLRERGVTSPLEGSHVIKVAAEMGHGRAASALRQMGVELNAVIAAADAEIAAASDQT